MLCQMCYVKLDVCPTCQKKLIRISDGENPYGPIRSLIAENLIRQLPNIQIDELESLQTEMQQIKDVFQGPNTFQL